MTEVPAFTPIDRRALVRDAIRYSSLIGALVCAATALAGRPNLAIGVAIGVMLGAINFVLLARGVGGAIDRTVAGVERAVHERGERRERATDEGLEPQDVLGRPHSAGGSLRLALIVLLVAAILWFQPAEPAGLAIGIIITLIGASVAAHRHNQARQRTHGSPKITP